MSIARRLCLAGSSSVMALITAGLGLGISGAHAASGFNPDSPSLELVVVTAARGHAADLAPTKSSLDTFEPQSVIDRSFIEDSVPDVSDYTGIVTVAPSVSSGNDSNGPGLSEKDAVIRGFGDGEYNVRYDGIPFGDTNDPTHHSTSFFPASTVGAVIIDRGPGNAGDLGQETLGGSLNLFSRTLTDDPYAQQKVTLGSWNTRNFVTTLQSGVLPDLNGTRITANFQELQSDGYLSFEHIKENNQFLKVSTPINAHWNVTLLVTHNNGDTHVPDNDGITLAQAAVHGKNFTLSNDPTLPTFLGYNLQRKQTDFDYVRVQGDISKGLTLDDTAYSYFYSNHTLSATDTTQSANDILANTYPDFGTKAGPKGNKDIAGYDKLNSYRVWGNILRVSEDFSVADVAGQVRAGLWTEWSGTNRHRFDLDLTLGVPNPIEKTPAGVLPVPDPSIQFTERSSWAQYQPFVDVELHPAEGLTLTTGVKYLNFTRSIAALIGSKTRGPQFESATFERTQPFATANYRVNDHWSVYGQYAEGFLVPPLKSFYVPNPQFNTIKPQTSRNFQLGTVYNVENLSLDADIYYIRAENAFQSGTVAVPGQGFQKIFFNDGTVDYRGVEGEGTYSFSDGILDGLAGFLNGSLNEARGLTPGMSNFHKQLGGVPKWTTAFGLIYKNNGVLLSMINKIDGEQWGADGEPSAYRIGAYEVTNLVGGYDFGQIKLQAGVFNLFNNRNVTDISVNDGPTPTDPNSHDQFFWLPERSFQVTLRATLD